MRILPIFFRTFFVALAHFFLKQISGSTVCFRHMSMLNVILLLFELCRSLLSMPHMSNLECWRDAGHTQCVLRRASIPKKTSCSSICSSGVGCIPVSCSKSMKWLMGLWHLMATIWHVMNWKEVSRSDKRPIPDTQLSPRYGQRSRLRPGKLTKRLRLLVGCKGKDFGKNPELYPALNTFVCANKHAGKWSQITDWKP